MRRVASVLLLIIGGWILMTEMVVAFLDVQPGAGDNFWMLIAFSLVAALLLLLGAWASPGNRWRELGLTVLIAAGFTAFAALSMAAVFLDPAAARYMPNLPPIRLAPVIGGINLAVVTALGWWLYQRKAPDPADAFR